MSPGGKELTHLIRKKKKKSHSSSDRTAVDPAVESSKKIRDVQEKAADRSLDELEDDVSREKELELERALAAQTGKGGRKMTEAERRFEEKRRQRVRWGLYSVITRAGPRAWQSVLKETDLKVSTEVTGADEF